MEDLNKRPYSRCMYGNYKMDTLEAKNGSERLKSGSKWIFAAAAIIILGIIIWFIGCKTQQTVIKEETVTRYVDSTIWHTDTTYFEVPKEVYADYTSLLDTLVLETNYALSWSAIDTNNRLLVGEISNKDFKIPIKYLWKEHIVYQDSIVEKTKEVPVEVVVDKVRNSTFAWICIIWSVLSIVLIGVWVYLKFCKP